MVWSWDTREGFGRSLRGSSRRFAGNTKPRRVLLRAGATAVRERLCAPGGHSRTGGGTAR